MLCKNVNILDGIAIAVKHVLAHYEKENNLLLLL